MNVGLLHARLLLRESRSLKDKRQVVRSILDRLRNHFNVSAAEVGHLDDVKVLELGISTTGPELKVVRSVLQTIHDGLRSHPVAEFISGEITIGHEVV